MADEQNAGKDTGNDNGDKPAGEHINLRVVAQVRRRLLPVSAFFPLSQRFYPQDGGEVLFKIKRSTPLRKLMDAYCQKQSISPTSLRFLFDGKRVQPDQSPQDVCLNNPLYLLPSPHDFPRTDRHGRRRHSRCCRATNWRFSQFVSAPVPAHDEI